MSFERSLDRLKLLRDATYFARELRKRIERLEDRERDGHLKTYWQQAAAAVGRVGKLTAEEAVREHNRREREARAEALREARL